MGFQSSIHLNISHLDSDFLKKLEVKIIKYSHITHVAVVTVNRSTCDESFRGSICVLDVSVAADCRLYSTAGDRNTSHVHEEGTCRMDARRHVAHVG